MCARIYAVPNSNCLLICMTIKAAPDATHAAGGAAGGTDDDEGDVETDDGRIMRE